MSSDDRLKKYQDAGADFIESAASKAEDLLRELSRLGESTGKQATSRAGDIVGGSGQFLDAIRKEISSQLRTLATKADLEALERRLGLRSDKSTDSDAASSPPPAAKKAAAVKKTATAKATTAKKTATAKAAPVKRAATAKAAPVKRAASTKATAARSTAKKAAPSAGAS